MLTREYGGKFPESSEAWRSLPGIGRYTASAIASIAYDEPVAVVDGNVERVVERLAGKRLAHEATWEAAQRVLDRARPGDFNQAMMELGATTCLPRQPRCLLCPVAEFALHEGNWLRVETAARQKKRAIHFGLARRDSHVLLVKRPKEESLMPGMWELPERPQRAGEKILLSLRHSITITDYTVRVVELPAADKVPASGWHSRAYIRCR